MIKHPLRTLLKEGDKEDLKLGGYEKINAKIINFNCQYRVKIGEDLVFFLFYKILDRVTLELNVLFIFY
jgi:hypothetical protein